MANNIIAYEHEENKASRKPKRIGIQMGVCEFLMVFIKHYTW